MEDKGKYPDRGVPLSQESSGNYISRIDQVFRFVIDNLDPADKTRLTHDQADWIIKALNRDWILRQDGDEYSENGKRKFSNTLNKYFDWRHDQFGDDQWRPRIKFSDGEHESADKLNFKERWLVRETAKDYGSLPSYYETSEEKREKINSLVAQRIGKPKDEITRKDWERADSSTKVASLIAVALETGIIPIEVERAKTTWYDRERNVLKITKEESGKDRPSTELPLTEETGELLVEWIQERRYYEKYDDTDLLWLNQDGNSYDSKNLCYLLRRLCEEAGIDHENRKIVWYSLRHNLGQSMEETEDLSQAKDQLRHDHIETTKNTYGESSIESRRYTLEKISETARRTAEDPDFNPYGDEDVTPTSESQNNGSTQSTSREVDTTVSASRDDTSSSTPSSTKHIDVVIDDTQDAKVDITRQILADDI